MQELIKARDLLAKGFCKDNLACDAEGKAIGYEDPKAAQFCILGAMLIASDDNVNYDKVVPLLASQLPQPWVEMHPNWQMSALIAFNNHWETTQADIVALFDRAIEKAAA